MIAQIERCDGFRANAWWGSPHQATGEVRGRSDNRPRGQPALLSHAAAADSGVDETAKHARLAATVGTAGRATLGLPGWAQARIVRRPARSIVTEISTRPMSRVAPSEDACHHATSRRITGVALAAGATCRTHSRSAGGPVSRWARGATVGAGGIGIGAGRAWGAPAIAVATGVGPGRAHRAGTAAARAGVGAGRARIAQPAEPIVVAERPCRAYRAGVDGCAATGVGSSRCARRAGHIAFAGTVRTRLAQPALAGVGIAVVVGAGRACRARLARRGADNAGGSLRAQRATGVALADAVRALVARRAARRAWHVVSGAGRARRTGGAVGAPAIRVVRASGTRNSGASATGAVVAARALFAGGDQ